MSIRAKHANTFLGRDPAVSFRFLVEVDNVYTAEFVECGGLTMEREVKQVQVGGLNNYVHILPGRVKYSNIVLKRGISHSLALWQWFCEGLETGIIKRKHISIVLGNAELKRVRQWDVADAFPVKWTGATLNASSRDVAIETLELAHHGITASPIPNAEVPFGPVSPQPPGGLPGLGI